MSPWAYYSTDEAAREAGRIAEAAGREIGVDVRFDGILTYPDGYGFVYRTKHSGDPLVRKAVAIATISAGNTDCRVKCYDHRHVYWERDVECYGVYVYDVVRNPKAVCGR